MRAAKGTGMSEEQVINFVNGCECIRILCSRPSSNHFPDYPCYELYTDVLREGIFGDEKGKQLRLVVGKDRRVKQVVKL